MFISNVSQLTNVSFNASSNRELKLGKRFLRRIYNGDLAKKIGVEIPKSKEEESKLLSDFFKNRFLIMLTHDPWAEKLKVRMPKSADEKNALIEILEKRKKSDEFAHKANEYWQLKCKLLDYRDLLKNDPTNSRITEIEEELNRMGNYVKTYYTLEKKYTLSRAKNKPTIDYFNEIEKMKELYAENGLISDTDLKPFLGDVEKNNINKDGKLNTQELLNIVTGKKANTEQVIEDTVPTLVPDAIILSKKQLLASAKSEFEGYLRKNIDFYRVMNDNFILSEQQKLSKTGSQPDVVTISITGVADRAHKAIYDKYALSIDKNKADDDLLKVFAKILNTYRMNAGKIGNMVLEMRNVGAYWRYMERDGIVELKGYKDKIADLEQKLKLNDADKDLIKEYSQIKVRLLNESDYVEALKDVETKLAGNRVANQYELKEKMALLKQELEKTAQYNERFAVLEKMLKSVNGSKKELLELIDTEYKMAENKYIWTQYLERAVEAEAFNRQCASEQKCAGIYNYITGENASIKNYHALDEIRKENEGKLPEEVWDKILTFANEDGTLSPEAWNKILA